MIKKIRELSKIVQGNKFINSLIKGIHVEGPFINPNIGYRGAHSKNAIIKANIDKAKQLLEAGDNLIKIVTLAPEYDENFDVTKYLSLNNVTVSAGHSNATLDDLNGAIDNGLKMFTHLGNGSPSIMPRHDNIINRVLSLSDKLFVCFIADGVHLPNFVLKNYLKIAGFEKSIIVTDCISAASAPPGKYSLSHIEVEVGEDKVVREVGKENLAGSAITMKDSELFLRDIIDLPNHLINKLLKENAAKLFGQ